MNTPSSFPVLKNILRYLKWSIRGWKAIIKLPVAIFLTAPFIAPALLFDLIYAGIGRIDRGRLSTRKRGIIASTVFVALCVFSTSIEASAQISFRETDSANQIDRPAREDEQIVPGHSQLSLRPTPKPSAKPTSTNAPTPVSTPIPASSERPTPTPTPITIPTPTPAPLYVGPLSRGLVQFVSSDFVQALDVENNLTCSFADEWEIYEDHYQTDQYCHFQIQDAGFTLIASEREGRLIGVTLTTDSPLAGDVNMPVALEVLRNFAKVEYASASPGQAARWIEDNSSLQIVERDFGETHFVYRNMYNTLELQLEWE